MTEFVQQMMEFEPELFNAALRLCKNEADAHDLLQETWIRGMRYEDKFEKGTNLRAWLHTILRNTFINEYRKRKKFMEYMTGQRETGAVDSKMQSAAPQSQHELVQGKHELQFLLEGLEGTMKDVFFDVLVLCDLEDKSYKEAAQILDRPIGTIMSRLFRARRAAREYLVNEYNREALREYISQDAIDSYQEDVA